MDKVERFGVSMPTELADMFDEAIRRKGYTNRSEAIRDIIRSYLVEEQWDLGDGEVMGTVTLVYDHHSHDLGHVLAEVQHESVDNVICTQHVHMDAHHCLETIVLRGLPDEVRGIADKLIAANGVKHGKLVCTTTGTDIH